MYKLPNNKDVKIEYLYKSLDSMTTSYKLFFLKAILDEIKNNNYEIEFEILVARMIENSWYIINEYKIDLGKMDKIEELINKLFNRNEIEKEYTKDELFKYILNNIDKGTVDYLMKYVVYRSIRPTFENSLEDIKDDVKQQKIIKELSKDNTEYIYRVDSINDKIIINPKWFNYIKNNEIDIDQWIWFNMIRFVIKRINSKNK